MESGKVRLCPSLRLSFQPRRVAPEGKREGEKGMVLVFTLAVIIILATLVMEFIYLIRVEAEIAGNYRDRLKAHYLANSGVSFAYRLLRDDKDLNCDSPEEEWAQAHMVQEGEGIITYRIVDECGKFNINSLLTKKGEIYEKRKAILERLFELLEIDSELVDVVCDWLDKDDATGDFGAEEDYYAHLEKPYSCKNGPLDTLEELFLLEGFDDAVFYGEDKERGSLEEYLTVWGEGKVNINTAPSLVRQALHSEIDETLAQEMGETRFEKLVDLKEISGMDDKLYNEISPFITVKSSSFSVQAWGSAGEARKGIKALLKREGNALKIGYWRIM